MDELEEKLEATMCKDSNNEVKISKKFLILELQLVILSIVSSILLVMPRSLESIMIRIISLHAKNYSKNIVMSPFER